MYQTSDLIQPDSSLNQASIQDRGRLESEIQDSPAKFRRRAIDLISEICDKLEGHSFAGVQKMPRTSRQAQVIIDVDLHRRLKRVVAMAALDDLGETLTIKEIIEGALVPQLKALEERYEARLEY